MIKYSTLKLCSVVYIGDINLDVARIQNAFKARRVCVKR